VCRLGIHESHMWRVRRLGIHESHMWRVRRLGIHERDVRRVRRLGVHERHLRRFPLMCVNLSDPGTGIRRKCCARYGCGKEYRNQGWFHRHFSRYLDGYGTWLRFVQAQRVK